jgi:hypothetical protein
MKLSDSFAGKLLLPTNETERFICGEVGFKPPVTTEIGEDQAVLVTHLRWVRVAFQREA